MQDIGGCRAVLNSIPDIRAVEERITRRGHLISRNDYIEVPRESGYRALHLVVAYRERLIEIQLRTRAMHDWAVTVERTSGRLRENYKRDGDHPVQQLFKVISEAMALEERGELVDDEMLTRLRLAHAAAAPYLRRV